MFDHWLQLAGVEIVSTARAARYGEALGITTVQCDVCPDFVRAVKDLPYTVPDDPDNPAPWYDPAMPESARFGGVVGLGVEGVSVGTGTRSRTALLGGGAALGAVHRSERELRVSTLLLAQDEAALSYGLAWLTATLQGSAYQESCGADELCFFAYCPGCSGLPVPDDPEDDTCGDAPLRRMLDVGLLADPRLTRRMAVPGGVLAEVEFGLVAGQSYLWHEPRWITGTGDPGIAPAPPIAPPAGCVETVDCATDPNCAAPPAPVRPPAPANPCYPGPPPINDQTRSIATVPGGVLPDWLEMVPVLEIYTGTLPLRQVTVRFYNNPAEHPCGEYVDPCTSCAEINIPYLPPGATFRLDGRTERATVDCPGGPGLEVAEVELYGPDGGMYDWPIFDCATALCVEFVARKSTVSPTMRLDLWMVARQDAA